ncbi:hypothetical protein [Haliovirga abyssi]|uniref:Lipocalin-like domain-containing protein n=1 Tax=Haliovirga abyssi TaxID=2996794 RepID=A0AAU9DTK8_9FUSO|nr:hypothetical protein [Haliovirga abyssi]BDU50514.1 hypothetical protein HLVA_10830 [Haliovirga abyssi]
MKKKWIVIMFLVTFTFILNAQSVDIIGSWMLKRVETGSNIKKMFIILTFEKNRILKYMGIKVGTWKWNNDNEIIMKSKEINDFNGNVKITKLTTNSLEMVKGKQKLYYDRFDYKNIENINKKANLNGVWEIKGEDSINFLKLDVSGNFTLISIEEGMSSTTKGTWVYNSKDKTVIVIGQPNILRGENKIISITKNKFILRNINRDEEIEANKKVLKSKIERLNFKYDNFDEEKENDSDLPWNDFYQMVDKLKNIKKLKYRKADLIEELGIFKYSEVISKVVVNSEKESIRFNDFRIVNDEEKKIHESYIDENTNIYNKFFPEKELYPYRILGNKIVTVPAGKFECTVVEGFDGDSKVKYWMINNKPGIYAKIIRENVDVFGELEYFMIELEKIEEL